MSNEDFRIEVIGQKIPLLGLQKELPKGAAEISNVDPKERAYGEPGTILALIAAGSIALPAVMAWLSRRKRGFEIEVTDSVTDSSGVVHKRLVRIKLTDSQPPTPEHLEQIRQLPGVDPTKLAEALRGFQ